MATLLAVGSDTGLLEGLAQSLGALGHEVLVATSFVDAVEIAAARPPLVAIAERALAMESPEVLRLPVAVGGALVVYHLPGDAAIGLPAALQRLVLADLTLPLERHRLAALVHSVEERARTAGRDRIAGDDALEQSG